MQKTFQIKDGEAQKVLELDRQLENGWKVILTTKINYGTTTLFILEKK